MQFTNRQEAGQKLSQLLKKYKNSKDAIVLGIPRGGIEVAFEIAKELNLQLSVIVTKKIGFPSDPEFAIGAASLDSYIVNQDYKEQVGKQYIEKTITELKKAIKKRYKDYLNGKIPELKNKIVIIADDGLATGYTMFAAIKYAKSKNPKRIIVAVPVAAQDSFEKAKKEADEIYYIDIPIFFGSVGAFYQDFQQLEDKDVKYYLKEAKKNYEK